MKAIVFLSRLQVNETNSSCGINPLACQITAGGLDRASQFLACCGRGAGWGCLGGGGAGVMGITPGFYVCFFCDVILPPNNLGVH